MFKILFSPKKAKRHPIEMMLVGVFYASLSILFGIWIFPGQASLVMVFLTVLSCLYIVQGTLKSEEDKERDYKTEEWLLKEHWKLLSFLLFLFIGFVFAFSFWTLVLPAEKVSVIFSTQKEVVEGIRNMVATGDVTSQGAFLAILKNNFKVLFVSLVFAFFYGAGAIFVLAWNASVMGFVIGELARETFGLVALPIAFMKYFFHGIPEMLAYLTIALMGGMVYVAVLREDVFKEGRLKTLVRDSIVLVAISAALLIVAALIEVYVSPLI
jgi:stage II sporulation protein M